MQIAYAAADGSCRGPSPSSRCQKISTPGSRSRCALYDSMVRIVVTPTWVQLNDFQRTAPRAVERLVQAKQGWSSLSASGSTLGMGGFHGRPAYADAGAALAVMRNRIVDMSAGSAIDHIVADDPGMGARRSRLTHLARVRPGIPYRDTEAFIKRHWGYPSNRPSLRRWINLVPARTTQDLLGSSRPGSARTTTAWTTWSGCAGQTGSSVRAAVTAVAGGCTTLGSSALAAGPAPR